MVTATPTMETETRDAPTREPCLEGITDKLSGLEAPKAALLAVAGTQSFIVSLRLL
jgi:hypothetical protein